MAKKKKLSNFFFYHSWTQTEPKQTQSAKVYIWFKSGSEEYVWIERGAVYLSIQRMYKVTANTFESHYLKLPREI